MARADYFDRAIQAVFHVLDNLDQDTFLKKIDKHRVAVAFDSSVNTAEGEAAVDLTIRLLARFYPKIAVIPLDVPAQDASQKFRLLAQAINPKIAIMERAFGIKDVIVVGNTPYPSKNEINPIYIGSDGWLARLSRKEPVGSKNSNNPFGAGFAACLAAANIFRGVFTSAPLDDDINISVFGLNPQAQKQNNPKFVKQDLGEVHLVGAGAVGNGFLWAISRSSNLTGRLNIIDHDDVDLFNIQRYVLTERKDYGVSKAKKAADLFEYHPGITAMPIPQKWGDFVASRPESQWAFERVISALDTGEDRIHLQSSLPKWIANAWTGAGDIGVSHHDFLNSACMACLYMPEGEVLHEDQLIAQSLGFPDDRKTLQEIRTMIETSSLVDRAFLERISAQKDVPLKKLLQFEGQSLRALYSAGVCSGAVMELTNGPVVQRAEVPMPFQSALAGILQAALLVSHVGEGACLPMMTRLNLMKPFPVDHGFSWNLSKNVKCFCVDKDYRDVYREKYTE